MSNPIFEEIRKTTKPETKAYIWLQMLIEYDLDGNASIVKSMSKPASDSIIKAFVRDKKKKPVKLEFDNTESDSSDLF